MRKFLIAGLVTLVFTSMVSAAQRGAAVPAMSAPPPAMRAMPAPAAPTMHVPVATARPPVAAAHAPVAGNHLMSPRGSNPARPGTSTRTGAHSPTPTRPSSLPSKAANTGGYPVNPIAPPGPVKPFIPGFLPPDTFTGQSCYIGNCYPVPGFGFDYEHFFAVHPNWGKYQAQFTGVVVPGWGGGFYYPVPYYSEPTPQEEQGGNVAVPVEQQESSLRPAPAPEENAPMVVARPYSYAPAQPVEEYVFVKRDGTRIFAVAYSLIKDKVQYITKEGLRRTLALDSLDYDATMKSNEERGNTINLPGVPPAAMAMVR